MDGVQATIG